MNRLSMTLKNMFVTVPHERGDEPAIAGKFNEALVCSPRAWG